MDKTFSEQMNELSDFVKGYTPLRTVKPTIECGQPAHLVSFNDEHPEPYSDELLKKMKHHWLKEILGFVGCTIVITSMFFGLISTL